MAADAADAALEAPRALMIAAPRCCTYGMKVSRYQLVSTAPATVLPSTSAKRMSGYWVELWLPQITIFAIFEWWVHNLPASWARARLWSRRVIAVKLRGFRS